MKLLSIIILILLMQSCVKENSTQSYNPKNYYFYLTSAQISQTPYFTNPAFNTIGFASNKGDTLTFVKTKTDTTWYCERTTSNPDNNDQNCYQTLHNTYATIKGNGSFDVNLGFDGSVYVLKLNFNNNNYSLINDLIGYNGPKGYIDKISFNNIQYEKVTNVNYTGTNANNNIYLNNQFGLIRIEFISEKINFTVYKR
jgi:hypothetical protein